MAMVRMEPVEVHVKAGWLDGTPQEITWGEVRLPVKKLTAIRSETSAYKLEIGPRTIFEVETPGAKLSLAFSHRGRRWTVDGVDDEIGLN